MVMWDNERDHCTSGLKLGSFGAKKVNKFYWFISFGSLSYPFKGANQTKPTGNLGGA